MNSAFSIVLLLILLDCVTNANSLTLKGCHVPLTAFYRLVKALLYENKFSNCLKGSVNGPLSKGFDHCYNEFKMSSFRAASTERDRLELLSPCDR